MNLNTNIHSQRGRWEEGQSHVGGDCYHTIFNFISKRKPWYFFMPIVGAMAIASYKFSNTLFSGALENSTLRDSKC